MGGFAMYCFLSFRGVFFVPLCLPVFLLLGSSFVHSKDLPSYVGADVCQECHLAEYTSFMTYAKKSRSFESIEKLKKGLTVEEIKKCYSCHTTGYGKPGGFVSPETTPNLKNAGCEVCHGPGSNHIASQNRQDIKRSMTTEDCEVCHISERVKAFRYKPMIHGGAH